MDDASWEVPSLACEECIGEDDHCKSVPAISKGLPTRLGARADRLPRRAAEEDSSNGYVDASVRALRGGWKMTTTPGIPNVVRSCDE